MVKVDVIVPVFHNGPTLKEIFLRLKSCCEVLAWDYRILFVDDACPEGSGKVLREIAGRSSRVQVERHTKNLGQHAAVMTGLRASRAGYAVVIDADLQDPPEALPLLWKKITEGFAVVFAARRGQYESNLRMRSSRLFKGLLHRLTGVPRDAGYFLMMNSEAREALTKGEWEFPFLPAMIGCLKLSVASVPVARERRKAGVSAYSAFKRLKVAARVFWAVTEYKMRQLGLLKKGRT